MSVQTLAMLLSILWMLTLEAEAEKRLVCLEIQQMC